MKAVVITEPGPPAVLAVRDVAEPRPGRGEVLVRVAATAVNRADLLQRRGLYPAPGGWPAEVPGLEVAGVVTAAGEGVASPSPGDRVMALVGGGGYAEAVTVPAEHIIRLPDTLSFEEAAAIPEAFITAHDALRTRLGVRSGETLLVHAIGSGVGTAALQLAAAWGVRVIGTSRTPWKLDRARELGLDVGLEVESASFAEAVLEATGGAGVDAVLDLVGGPYLGDNLRSLRTLGRMAVVGLTAGRSAEIDLGTLLARRLTLVGTALRSRSAAEKADATRRFAEEASPLLGDGRIRPVLHTVIPAAEAARAHELLESNETFGKVVLKW